MLFPDEIVDASSITGADVSETVPAREDGDRRQAHRLAHPQVRPEQYHDTYRERVLDLIEQKAKGKEIVAPEPPKEKAEVLDLMAALEASIKSGRRSPARKRPATKKKAAAKKKAAPKKAAAKRKSA